MFSRKGLSQTVKNKFKRFPFLAYFKLTRKVLQYSMLSTISGKVLEEQDHCCLTIESLYICVSVAYVLIVKAFFLNSRC